MGIKTLHEYGNVAPVALIINEKDVIIHPMDFNDKAVAVQILRNICREKSAKKILIMGEAYHSHDLSGIRPSKAPDREESIIIQGEDVNGNSCAIIQPFYRNKKGRIKLKKKIKQLNVSPFGLMSGILM
jgi:hypothetical protein